MKAFRSLFLHAACGVLCALVSAQAAAQNNPATPVQQAVYKPLQAAQEALKNNQAQQAVSLAKEALTVFPITPAETTLVQRTLAVAALAAKDVDQAIASLEFLAAQPGLTPAEQRPFLESLMNATQGKKDFPALVKWARLYLASGGTNASVRPVLIQTLSLMNAHQEVVQEMQVKLKMDAAAGQKTPEPELRLLAVSYRQLKDPPGYEATLLQLLEAYPSKAYWAEAINRQANQPNANPRFELDLFRLLEETGNLEDDAEYIGMAELALKAGLPAEAKRVLDQGFQNAILGKGHSAAAHVQLRQQAANKLAEDDKLFAQMERTAKEGHALVGLGDVWLSKQDWAKAHVLYTQARAAGQVRREAELNLHHAIVLFKMGEVAQSRNWLTKVADDKTALAVANLWRIRTLTK